MLLNQIPALKNWGPTLNTNAFSQFIHCNDGRIVIAGYDERLF
ncbi:hypothetical protein ECDEC7B_5184 [Escherichia coli DEC7B]|nr:hypothetical protein ECDEC7B_5184 [Escherichia coli DEC7B]